MTEAKSNLPYKTTEPQTTYNLPKQEQPSDSQDFSIIGTKMGKCDICKTTKKILLLSYGFSLCQDCINICALILEQIQQNQTNSHKKTRAAKQKPKPRKIAITRKQKPNLSSKV